MRKARPGQEFERDLTTATEHPTRSSNWPVFSWLYVQMEGVVVEDELNEVAHQPNAATLQASHLPT